MAAREDDEYAARAERARQIALFRYQLIREPADAEVTSRQRGRMVRALAEQEHVDPFGNTVRYTRDTYDRWIRAWRRGGFEALVPVPRQCKPRIDAEVIDMALGLKKENPYRTAAQVRRILHLQLGWAPGERTLQRWFTEHGLGEAQAPGSPAVFGRFEASRPNEIWTGDAMHGPRIGGRKTFLFAFIDDHSRLLVGYRFGYAEDTVRLAAALRPALATRGVPDRIYVDNGSAFVDSWLLRACATLGIKLTHSTPGRPEGRGKIERVFGTVRSQFLVEVTGEDHVEGRHHVTDLPFPQRRYRFGLPPEAVDAKCRTYLRKQGKPLIRNDLIRTSDYNIVAAYGSEYRGYVQYYQLAGNINWLNKLRYVMERSMMSTLAATHRRPPWVMSKRYRSTVDTPHGKRRCYEAVQRTPSGKVFTARFGGIPLRRRRHARLIDGTWPTRRGRQLIARLKAGNCELCDSRDGITVHHVKRLADLNRYSATAPPRWVETMRARRRKTLIVCAHCHADIHQ